MLDKNIFVLYNKGYERQKMNRVKMVKIMGEEKTLRLFYCLSSVSVPLKTRQKLCSTGGRPLL